MWSLNSSTFIQVFGRKIRFQELIGACTWLAVLQNTFWPLL